MREIRPLLLRLLLAGAGVTGLYLLLLSRRTDYAGHFLAGFGGTLAIFVFALVYLPEKGTRLGASTAWIALAAIAGGALLEATVFRIAIFDPLDFVNQSLGAVLAACAVHGEPRSKGRAAAVAGFALLSLQGGFLLAFA